MRAAVLHKTAPQDDFSYTLPCERRQGVAVLQRLGETIMNTFKSLVLAAIVVAALATPGSARSVWDQINESAPLQPVFETLNDTAP
jgi:hypothetical protein